MKYFLFTGERLADEPVAELGGRTPLEAAKTPAMDELARKGALGMVRFLPNSLNPSPDIASLSMMGYDPAECYTGPAPIEAVAFGVQQDDREVIFRCDLVTILDHTLVDVAAGSIAEREADQLFSEIAEKFGNPRFHFVKGRGYKNFLVIRDPELLEELDEVECMSPYRALGENFEKFKLKGRAGKVLEELAGQVRGFLESHEINRVRIDLGENPANFIWLWGQGKRLKVSPFEKRSGMKGGLRSHADFARGLGLLMGLEAQSALTANSPDFLWIYPGEGDLSKARFDLKTKIRRIESFDTAISSVLSEIGDEDFRICVTTDILESTEKKSLLTGPVPFLIAGKGISPAGAAAFHEKACAQTQKNLDHKNFLDSFLKY